MKIRLLFLFLFFNFICIAQTGIGVMTDFSLYFETGEWELSRKQKKKVAQYYKSIENLENIKGGIGIMGYTDSIGSAATNDTLSILRARTLGAYIKELRPDIKINTHIGERDSLHFSLPLDQQRRADIIIGLLCGFQEEDLNRFYGGDGIYVKPIYLTPKTQNYISNDTYFAVSPYTSARQMISAEVNAIDSENAILKAFGMAHICVDENWQAWKGYKVYIPISGVIHRDLKVYKKTIGTEKWQQTNIKVDIEKNHYVFHIKEETGCISVCLGKPAQTKPGANSYKTIYISSYKPFNFEDVKISSKKLALSYSAKLNDTLMAFTLPAKQTARPMTFEGYYTENGVAKQLTVPLRKCSFTRDKSGNEWYYITEESLLQKEPEKKKKGFWQWLKNLF